MSTGFFLITFVWAVIGGKPYVQSEVYSMDGVVKTFASRSDCNDAAKQFFVDIQNDHESREDSYAVCVPSGS